MDEEQGWVPASYLEPEDGSVESAVATTYKPGGMVKMCQCRTVGAVAKNIKCLKLTFFQWSSAVSRHFY